jgi:hypothetical protein
MQKTQKILQTAFWLYVAVAALIVLVFETGIALAGSVSSPITLFYMAIVMQLLTIAVIPVALYLFRAPIVSQSLTADGLKAPLALCRWGLLRITMLGLPLVVNTLFYYLCGHDVRYFYLALILLLCLFFVYPSLRRCQSECESEKSE